MEESMEIDRGKTPFAGANIRNSLFRLLIFRQLCSINYSSAKFEAFIFLFFLFGFCEGEEKKEIKQIVVVLMGLPGSGKSTFCEEVMKIAPRPWARVCQVYLHCKYQ